MSTLRYEELKGDCWAEYFKSQTNAFQTRYIHCNGCVIAEAFKRDGDRIQQLDVRDDDIWLCSFPKSGTTWAEEIVWCIVNNLNFDRAAKETIKVRFPCIEATSNRNFRKLLDERPELNLADYGINPECKLDSVSYVEKMRSPRCIMTHLFYELLPQKLRTNSTSAKIIYVMRHPGDVCVSAHHYRRLVDGVMCSLEDFCELFLRGLVPRGPYWDHIRGYWQQRCNSNILIIRYEDMKKDLRSVIGRISNFLSKPMTTVEVDQLVDHVSFKNMKNNPAVNFNNEIELYKSVNSTVSDDEASFIRKGKVGTWRQEVGPSLTERFDEWIRRHSKDLNIEF